MRLRIAWCLLGSLVLAGAAFYLLGQGFFGRHEGAGVVTNIERDQAIRTERDTAGASVARALGEGPRRILFGDLHVHTTFSSDAYVMSLPLVSGEGAHPPADACDFARHCSALDFWSINDHAESLTPERWQETIDSIRQCNAVTDDRNPDTTAFLGWEWSQDGTTPKTIGDIAISSCATSMKRASRRDRLAPGAATARSILSPWRPRRGPVWPS